MYAWSAEIDGYGVFRRDRQGKKGCGVSSVCTEYLDCMKLGDGDERAVCLWIRVRGKGNKADITDHPTRMKRKTKYPTSN